jgi:hypothetical protein
MPAPRQTPRARDRRPCSSSTPATRTTSAAPHFLRPGLARPVPRLASHRDERKHGGRPTPIHPLAPPGGDGGDHRPRRLLCSTTDGRRCSSAGEVFMHPHFAETNKGSRAPPCLHRRDLFPLATLPPAATVARAARLHQPPGRRRQLRPSSVLFSFISCLGSLARGRAQPWRPPSADAPNARHPRL